MLNSLFKIEIYRNKKLLNASRNRPCSFCDNDDGTTVRAHFSASGAIRLGLGKGIKPHDHASADACSKCHKWLDGEGLKDPDIYEKWFFASMETLRRDLEEGILK